MSRKTAQTERDEFIEGLKGVIKEYQTKAERLIAGTDRIFSTGRDAEEISVETAVHYKSLISHYGRIVARHEAEKQEKNL